ncbi:ArsI/CadI family heavy metal resistance metalloenzyme [Micromonospora sp. RB23]
MTRDGDCQQHRPREQDGPGGDGESRRDGSAAAVENPPLKLVLIEGEADQPTVLDHLGVEVFTTDDVTAATKRLTDSGLITLEENDTECCYALQDKVWVRAPGDERWEVYTVKADADTLAKATDTEPVASGVASPCC